MAERSKAEVIRDLLVGAAALLGSVAVPAAGLYAAQLQHRSELAKQYVEIGVSILKEPETQTSAKDVRAWARAVVNRYSPIPLSSAAAKQLSIQTVHVPVAVSCAPDVGPRPTYSDAAAALSSAPDIFTRVRLLLVGRAERDARLAVVEAALQACAKARP